MKIIPILLLSITILFSFHNTQTQDQTSEERIFLKLKNTNLENEAIKILNEMIYQKLSFSSLSAFKLISDRKWLKATGLIVDYLLDITKSDTQNEISIFLSDSKVYLNDVKNILKNKKKNIVKISPVFEWSQDNELVKIRLKFAKNLESPGEKNIQNFKVTCLRTRLIVHGYKSHEDYVAYYFRDIQLYDLIKHRTCKAYKETDGTYIIKFSKNQPTLYWNHLDLFTEDHHNMYTWFDVFTQYDDKAKYTEFREFTQQNLLEKDIKDYESEKSEEKKLRVRKIKKILEHFKTKDYENKNYCNSPVNEKFCFLVNIYDWNYWLS